MVALSQVSHLMDSFAEIDSKIYPHVWCDGENLVVGTYPNASVRFDFVSDKFVQVGPSDAIDKKRVSFVHLARRDTGQRFEIHTKDVVYEFASATQTLLRGLEILENLRPGILDQLALVKGRSKRPVSRNRDELYDLRSQRQHAERISTGHFVGTNNKTPEALGVLRKAARLAKLSEVEFSVTRRRN